MENRWEVLAEKLKNINNDINRVQLTKIIRAHTDLNLRTSFGIAILVKALLKNKQED